MRHRLGILCVLMAAAGAVPDAQVAPSVDAALMAAQSRFQEAQKTCDAAGMAKLVTEDMLVLHADGRVEDKQAFAKFVSQCVLEDIRFDVKTVRLYGDVAVLTGTLPFKIKQGPSMSFAVTQVYVKRNGTWLFASHQSTDAASFGVPKK